MGCKPGRCFIGFIKNDVIFGENETEVATTEIDCRMQVLQINLHHFKAATSALVLLLMSAGANVALVEEA